MKLHTLLILAGVLAISAIAADAPTKTIAQRMADLNVPGVSIAFIEDGRVKWTRTYGVAVASERRAVFAGGWTLGLPWALVL